jgi:hypothetical protein
MLARPLLVDSQPMDSTSALSRDKAKLTNQLQEEIR